MMYYHIQTIGVDLYRKGKQRKQNIVHTTLQPKKQNFRNEKSKNKKAKEEEAQGVKKFDSDSYVALKKMIQK